MIAPTTTNESWKPVEKSSFVSQQKRKKAAAARLLSTKDFSLEEETAEEDRSHHGSAHTRNLQSRYCRVKKE